MKAVIIDALDKEHISGLVDVLMQELKQLAIVIDHYDLGTLDFEKCRECYHCWLKTPGKCVIQDPGNDWVRAIVQSDLVVVVTAIRDDGIGRDVAEMFKRMIPTLAQPLKKAKRPRLFGVGLSLERDTMLEKNFQEKIRRLAIDFRFTAYDSIIIDSEEDFLQHTEIIHAKISKANQL
ncbi:hypothetical protein BHU72_04470 [Desulfuribacillus stibiiarsenatis]|uniref:NADPH-dependent FMN reductase-like domain-containing protein n=1 Tax=Desulfuribacillus stibiiarsenatis TaxID=1390249 RepID=A0A1E5L5R9_9FIRM|nr:hypothetical protein [Desulfuribacillus stibiiarsenatis]OEH85353.1 hypothetical protein BHU72_04470 [Desulfuribacillus stibiiarsenatis]